MIKGKHKGKETGKSKTPEKGHGIRFIVADRFVAGVGSSYFGDLKVLHNLVDALDLAALEKLVRRRPPNEAAG